MVSGRIIVYGGKGALGATCVSYFKAHNFWVGSVDINENPEADANILVDSKINLPEQKIVPGSLLEQEANVLNNLATELQNAKLDAVICVAGGWAGGNAASDLANTADLMWRQSVWSSIISASIASKYLKEGGLLSLTGANAALQATPGMIGYGMAKAAVHHLTKSLAGTDGGLPNGAIAVAILPITLDTPMNRKWMPKSDFTTWTPLEYVADLFLRWTYHKERPDNGSLLQLATKHSNTTITSVQ